jgi:transposase-like protein
VKAIVLWRAVDDEGEVLDLLVQSRRDRSAHAAVHNHFTTQHHLISRRTLRIYRAQA